MVAQSRRSPLLLAAALLILAVAPFDEGAGRDLLPRTVLAVASVLVLTALLRRGLGGGAGASAAVRSPALLPLVCLVAVGGASMAWSVDRFVTATGVARLLACAAAFLIALNEGNAKRRARALAAMFVGVALLMAARGLCEVALHGGRARSVFVTPNTFAGFLIIGLPMAFVLSLTARRGASRLAWAAGAAVLVAALFATRSFGATLALAAATPALIWELSRQGAARREHRPRLLPVFGVTLAAVLAILAFLWASPGWRAGALSLLPSHKAATAEERFVYWNSTLEMIRDAWPLGTGLDTYHLDYPAHRHVSLAGTDQWFAHNDYLQLLAETGPLALLALLWLLWRTGWMTHTVLRVADADSAALAAGAWTGAAAALLHGLVDFNLYVPATAVGIFLCLGLLAGTYAGLAPSPVRTRWQRRVLRRALSPAILALGTAAAVFAVRPLVAQRLLQRSPYNTPLAVVFCPWSAHYQALLGDMRARCDPPAARENYLEAVRLSPRNAAVRARLGRFLRKTGKPGAASADTRDGLRHLRRACELDRYSPLWRLWLAQACLDDGLRAEARQHLEFCLEVCRPDEKLRRRAVRLLDAASQAQGKGTNAADADPREPEERVHPHRGHRRHHHHGDPGRDRGAAVRQRP